MTDNITLHNNKVEAKKLARRIKRALPAADRIAELEARVEALEQELQIEQLLKNSDKKLLERITSQRDEAEARVEALEGALHKAGCLAEAERWPERFPLVFSAMAAQEDK